MNIRSVDGRDLNVFGYLVEDLYKMLQCEIKVKVYVLEENNSKSILIVHDNKIYIYQNGINQLLTYMPKDQFFSLNCGVLFCYENINDNSLYQMAFPYRMDFFNPNIQVNWLHDPAYIVKSQGNKKMTFEYCCDDTDPFIYVFQM